MSRRPELRRGSRRRRDDAAWPVVLCAALLAGAVAAAVSAAMMRFAPVDVPRIASVRLGGMTAAYAVKAAEAQSSPVSAASDARAWGTALETALGRVAHQHRVVLLPARAVAAGAPDLTAEVEAALSGLLAAAGRGEAVVQERAKP